MNEQKLLIFFNSIVAFLWVIFIYFINNEIYLIYPKQLKYNHIFNIFIYLFIIILGSYIIKWRLKKLNYKLKSNNIHLKKIIPLYKDYLPIFLGIVIVSLSLKDSYSITVGICIFLFLFIIFYMSKIAFLNPILYLLGFRVYKIETDKTEYILISNERDYKNMMNDNDNIKIKKLDEETLVCIRE